MSSVLSNRLSLIVFSVLGSALVLAEGRASRTAEDATFTFNTFRAVAKEQMPSVVNIISQLREEKTLEGASGPTEEPAVAQESPNKGMGSGLVLSEDGYILTNFHVVEDNDTVQVVLSDSTSLQGRVVGRDAETDVALVKVDAPRKLQPGSLGDSSKAEPGDWVMAIGSPFGLSNSLSAGIISAIGRDIHTGNYDNFIQTDASINVGNSGGPLFNIRGEVIGINTAILSSTGGSNGIGFAIPINDIKPVVAQLRARGHVTRGWLGVALQDAGPDEDLVVPVKAAGSMVTDVWDGSPAAKAGMVEGDVIVRFGQRKIDTTRSLLFAVASSRIGSVVPVEVVRHGRRVLMDVVIVERPEQNEVIASAAGDEEPREPGRGLASAQLQLGSSKGRR